jgi:transposase
MVEYTRKQLEAKDKDELIDIILVMQSIIKTLVERVDTLEKEVKYLKKPTTSHNSSLPPSKDLFKHKNQSLRPKSNRKTGGQPGHTGHTLEMSDTPDYIRHHFPQGNCPCCNKTYTTSDFFIFDKRQVIDIPQIKSTVTDHLVYGINCSCGHQHKGTFPSIVNAPVQYGTNLTTLVSYLSARQFVPMGRLTELVRSITNISMSQGTVFNMLDRVANSLLPLYGGIKDAVANAGIVGGDETGLKVNSDKNWGWTWQTANETYIVNSKTRGYITVAENFPDGFHNAIYVSDSLSAQLKTPAKAHQPCLAHLSRELNSFIEKNKSRWAGKMKKLLTDSMNLKKRMKLQDYGQCVERDKILEGFNVLINEIIPGDNKKLHAFQRRLKKLRLGIFTFLFHPDVPFDNNASERAIRNIKVKQKISGEFRSNRGADIFAVIRSVVDTIIKKGGDPMPALAFALNIDAQKRDFLRIRK